MFRRFAMSHLPPSGGRLLWIRTGGATGGPPPEVPGWQVTVSGAVPAPHPAGVWDAIVLESGFEREPWPRWSLQRLHRALRTGGVLVLRAPAPGETTGPRDLLDAADSLAFLARRFVHKRLRRGTPFPHLPASTRLSDAALDEALDAIHFEVVARARPRALAARRLPSRWGEPGLPWPDAARLIVAHELAVAPDLARRNAWAAAHPRWSSAPVETLDPARWAHRDIVLLSPHPDDEVLGCGGTALRAQAAGARVTCVQATDGSAGAGLVHVSEARKRHQRVEEAEAVARAAGFHELVLWREDNRRFAPGPGRAEELATMLADRRAAAVFVPFVTDIHPDHQRLAELLVQALERRPGAWGDLQVIQYEVWSAVWPTHVCDVTDVMPALEDLLLLYDTAMGPEDYLHFGERRNHYNALVRLGRPGYAELFHAVPAADFASFRRECGPTA